MKTRIIALLSLMTISSTYTQEYVPFPTENASWKEIVILPACSDNHYGYCNADEFNLEGDTIINQQTYQKVFLFTQDPFFSEISKWYYGEIRNDIEKKHVYWNYYGEEKLLYDFNLKLGDTTYVLEDSAVVDSIVMTDINGSMRKSFWLSSIKQDYVYYPYQIIEGIGSLNGLFNGPNFRIGFEWYHSYLVCHKYNNSILYEQNIYGVDCESLITSNNSEVLKKGIDIFPTIFDSYIRIETDLIEIDYEIYNLQGELIRKGTEKEIETSILDIGNYLIIVRDSETIIASQYLIKK